ncbi:unnamed protein product [Calypogeia fissa]
MKKAWFINALPKKMQFWVKNQKPHNFEQAFFFADSYINAKASEKKKKKKDKEESEESEDSEEEKKKKKKKKKSKKEESSSSESSSSESEDEESESETEEKAKDDAKTEKKAKEREKRLKEEYDTKMDAISSQLHALSLQFTEEETKKHKGVTTEYFLESDTENVYTIGAGAPKDLAGRAVPKLPMDAGGRQKSYTLILDPTIPLGPNVRRVPICYNCGEPGHTLYTCPKPRRQGDGKGAKLCIICQLEGHLSPSCPVAMAAKSMLMSMGGAAAKTVAGPDSSVQMITLAEVDDEASDGEEWEHGSELPGVMSGEEESCYRVSTRTEKCLERLKKLKDKRKQSTDEEASSSKKVDNAYDRKNPSLFFPTITEDVKQQLVAEEEREAIEAMKKDLVIAEGLKTIDLLTKKLEEVRPKANPPEDKPAAASPKRPIPAHLARLPEVIQPVNPTLPTEADGEIIPFSIKKEVCNFPVHTTVGALLSNHNIFQKELKGLFIRKRRRRLPPVGRVEGVNMIFEDLGQPEVGLMILGCMIPFTPIDGGSGVNVILQTTTEKLGILKLEPTSSTMRMANGARVVPVGTLTTLGTNIGGIDFPLNYLVMRPVRPSGFPVLIGRPWLYGAGVTTDWA